MVVNSRHKFGDKLTGQEAAAFGKRSISMNTLWRQLLLGQFCADRWAMCVDVDEFVDLPPSMKLTDLAVMLDAKGADGAWSVMLDMYPGQVGDLARMSSEVALNLEADWYFDGEPHLRLNASGDPSLVYSGTRARLLQKYGLNHRVKPWKTAIMRMLGRPPPHFNDVHKPVFLRWREDAVMTGPHTVNLTCSPTILLPMRHYKFSGETYQRMDWALKSEGYAGGSVYYSSVERLLRRMSQENASFLYDPSRLHQSFDDFTETGNALGFD